MLQEPLLGPSFAGDSASPSAVAVPLAVLPPPPVFLTTYVSLLRRYWLFVAVAWLAVSVYGGMCLGRALSEVQYSFEARGSALAAQQAYARAFPRAQRSISTLLVVQAASGGVVPLDALRNASSSLGAWAAGRQQEFGLVALPVTYTTLLDAGYPLSAAAFMSTDGRVALASLASVGKSTSLVDSLADALPTLLPPGLTGGLTGVNALNAASNAAVEKDIVSSDVVSVPLSFMLLALVHRSLRVVAFTLLALLAALLTTFAFELQVGYAAPVPSFAISLVVATVLAISLDYSLFQFSFLRDRVASLRAADPEAGVVATMEAGVTSMLRSTGLTLSVSGATLACCFFCLALFPVALLRWPGVCAGICVCVCVAVNLSLVPALLLAFPHTLFGHAFAPPRPRPAGRLGGALRALDRASLALERASSRAWRRLALLTRSRRITISVGFTLLLVVPALPHLPHFSYSLSWQSTVPKGAQSMALYTRIADAFGGAAVYEPSLLLGVLRTGGSVLDPPAWQGVGDAVSAVLAARPDTLVPAGIAWAAGAPVPLSLVTASLATACPSSLACAQQCGEAVCLVQASAARSLGAQQAAVAVALVSPFDPFSREGYKWVLDLRRSVAALSAADPLYSWSLVPDGGTVLQDIVKYGELGAARSPASAAPTIYPRCADARRNAQSIISFLL